MAISGILIGRDAVAYWNTQGTIFDNTDQAAAQAWIDLATTVPADNLMDATDNIDSEMADATTRAEAKLGWAAEVAVLKTGQIQFDFRWEPADPFTSALISAWDSGNGISMAFMDQDAKTTGAKDAQGLGAVFSVSLSKTEALRDIQKASCTLSVATNPLWVITNNAP